MWGKYPGLLYIGKKGREMKQWQAAGENSSGFTNKQFPQDGAFSGDLLDQKSVHAIPWGWGVGGCMFTND